MRRTHSRERGQTIPIFAMLLVLFIGMAGLAVDAGRLYIAKAELGRALDSAALAGVIELPSLPNAESRALAYMQDNQPDAVTSFPATQASNQFKVNGSRNVDFIFMRILGFNSMDVTAHAAAGFGTVPVDTYISIDATGSMHDGCNAAETNTGGACPIKEARDAAKSFTDLLLGSGPGSGMTLIGIGAQRGCFNLPRNHAACVDSTPPGSMVTNLSSNAATIKTGIDAMHATGGSGTNVCLGLKKAQDILFGVGHHTASNTVRSVVILSDGDNNYNATVANQAAPLSPNPPCRPSSPTTSDGSGTCTSAAQPQEKKLDVLTKSLADTLAGQNVEIYVIAFGVCSSNATVKSASYCNDIGNNDPDNTADQRLLKCMASSHAGTNDHYYAVSTAANLGNVFRDVARAIAFRLIE